MWRDDRLYDVVLILDWNLTSRVRGRGSAIFLHVEPDGSNGTQGCIGIEPVLFRRLAPLLKAGLLVDVL